MSSSSSSSSSPPTPSTFEWSDLPRECWQLILQSHTLHNHFDSLSLVCKLFHSIISNLHSSLTIHNSSIPFIPKLLSRFPSFNSIDFSHFTGNLNTLLAQISKSHLSIKTLNISNQECVPVDGLRKLGRNLKMRNGLRVLICSGICDIYDSDLVVIADLFPFLEEIDVGFPDFDPKFTVSDSGFLDLSVKLRTLCKIRIGNCFITDVSLYSLFENCAFLREIVIKDCTFISQVGIASAIVKRPDLISVSLSNVKDLSLPIVSSFVDSMKMLKNLTVFEFSFVSVSDELLCSMADENLPLNKFILRHCSNYTFSGISCVLAKCQSLQYLDLQNSKLTDQDMKELSLFLCNVTFIDLSYSTNLTSLTFVTLLRNCPLLSEIRMENTDLGTAGLNEEYCLNEVVVNSHVKRFYLGFNFKLNDEDVKRFVSMCPNLELLDITGHLTITKGVFEALRDCHKITHLSIAACAAVTGFEIGFALPKLEVLNLSDSRVDDDALLTVSKTCFGLTHLDLENCFDVTSSGVRYVVEKCRRLRKINLRNCDKVCADIIPWMVCSSSSLRKIVAPPNFGASESQIKLFLRHGCCVC